MRFRISFNRSFEGVRPELWVCLFLVAAILVSYWPVGGYEFINFDDPQYVVDNHQVGRGLTFEGTKWAFTTMHAANWHPLTWLSHMLDVQMYGMNAGAHHLTNVIFHILNSMLLFVLLHRMTGALWRSAMVAALFAVHPLHVESVAWISERKDVLSTFFGLLALLAYAEYVKRPGWVRYGAALLFFALGLMSKPMVVTLPFLMLVLDYWPLNRYPEQGGFWRFAALVKEKLPFFAMAAASCVATMIAQDRGGAVAPLEMYSFGVRLTNALVAYVMYMGKMIWPVNLSVFYPHPGIRPLWQVAGASLLLLGITSFALMQTKRRPWFAVGWLWYLGTLVPVIGLMQVGKQAIADRYTYLPYIGLFLIISWTTIEAMMHQRYSHPLVRLLIGIFLITGLTTASHHQIKHWRNDVALYSNAIKIEPDNELAHYNLGVAFAQKAEYEQAQRHFEESLRVNPANKKAYDDLGRIASLQGDHKSAVSYYSSALNFKSNDPDTLFSLSSAHVELKQPDKSFEYLAKVLDIDPNHFQAGVAMGIALARRGMNERAEAQFKKVIQNHPLNAEGYNNLGVFMANNGRYTEAIQYLKKSLEIDPDNNTARNHLGRALQDEYAEKQGGFVAE